MALEEDFVNPKKRISIIIVIVVIIALLGVACDSKTGSLLENNPTNPSLESESTLPLEDIHSTEDPDNTDGDKPIRKESETLPPGSITTPTGPVIKQPMSPGTFKRAQEDPRPTERVEQIEQVTDPTEPDKTTKATAQAVKNTTKATEDKTPGRTINVPVEVDTSKIEVNISEATTPTEGKHVHEWVTKEKHHMSVWETVPQHICYCGLIKEDAGMNWEEFKEHLLTHCGEEHPVFCGGYTVATKDIMVSDYWLETWEECAICGERR